MLRWIRRQLDKYKTSPGLIRRGQWRVFYPDGEYSNRVTYDVATSYAEIFKGEVVWCRYHDPIYDRFPVTTHEGTTP